MNKITLPQFIDGLGAGKVAGLIGVDPATVRYWRNFVNCPRPESAAKLIELSLGLLSWESIYQPYIDHNKGKPGADILADFEE